MKPIFNTFKITFPKFIVFAILFTVFAVLMSGYFPTMSLAAPNNTQENLTLNSVDGSQPLTNDVFTVIFDMQGHGLQAEAQSVESGSCAKDPSSVRLVCASKYHLEGWYTDINFTNKYSFSSPVNSNLTLYAKWEKLTPENYVTEYFYNIGAWNQVYIYLWGNTASGKLEPAAWPGMEADVAGPSIFSFTIDKSLNLQQYIFNDNEKKNQTGDIKVESSNKLTTSPYYAPSPTSEDRTIWFDNSQSQWKEVWIMSKKDVSQKPAVETYSKMTKVESLNGDIWKYTYSNDEKFPPTDNFPRTCFMDAEKSELATNIIKNVCWTDTNRVMTPGYNIDAPMCNVAFDTQGHGVAPSSQSVILGGFVEQVIAPVCDGFTFDGWYKSSDFSEPWNFASDVVEQNNTTIYAKYTATQPLPKDESPKLDYSQSNLADTNDDVTLSLMLLVLLFVATSATLFTARQKMM